jgi:hypothetical protein
VGPQQGRKVFTLQTLPACDPDDLFADTVGQVAGFSLHAGVAVKARERAKLERLCRYITRPAVSEKRLSLTAQGKVRYELKTPYRDGTTHVIFEPTELPHCPKAGRRRKRSCSDEAKTQPSTTQVTAARAEEYLLA